MKNTLTFLLLLIALKTFSQSNQKEDWPNLKKYSGENKKLNNPLKGEKRIVFLGNSITEGWKKADSIFFSKPSYIDRGISGQVTAQLLSRFQQDVVDLKPAVVVILAGINDIAENNGPIAVEDIFKNIVSMIQLAKSNKIRIVISSVLPANSFPWRPVLTPADKVVALNAMLESYCKSQKIIYLDYYSRMVNSEKGLDKALAYDGVHPTLAGYKIMEPMVEDAISKALKKRK